MNATAWVRSQLDRPISDTERRAAFTAITVVLIAAALLLAMTGRGAPAQRPVRGPRHTETTARRAAPAPPPAAVLRTARAFLGGYLAFAYGRGPASGVKDTTSSFALALRKRARPVPPALRALHPRLIALHATPASAGAIVVTALVKDSEVLEYPIRVLLAVRGGRYLVSGLVGA